MLAPFIPNPASFEATLDSLSDGFWLLDPDWKFIYVNPEGCRSTGEDIDTLRGRSMWEAFPALVGTDVEREFRRAAAERITVELDNFYEPLGRWFGLKVFPLAYGGLAILSRDITSTKRAEAALRAAHDTFRHLVEHSPFGIYTVDADFRIVQASAGARKVFARVEPLLDRDFAEVLRLLWTEPFASEAIEHFRHTLATGEAYHAPSSVERRADIDTVESYDWKIERLVLPDGRFGVVCHFYDLTERQRFEAELRASEERFRLASEAASACVYDVDLTNQRQTIIHGLTGITGYRPEEVQLTTDWWLSLIHPDDLPAHRENLARYLERGGSYNAAYRIQRKGGEWVWVEATAQVFKNALGEAVQIVGTLVDVTQRRRAEEALRASEQNFRRLHSVSSRLLAAGDLESGLGDVLENAIATCGAVAGNIQLLNPTSGALEIVVHRGFKDEFLEHFREVRPSEGSACAQALESGRRMIIVDVEQDESFEPHRAIAAAAGYRAVQSTPLKTHDGIVVGMLSTHFPCPHRVSEADQQYLDLYARHAADLIARLRSEQALRDAERHKDQFLATLAHELRNPLAPLTNCIELLKRTAHDPDRVARAFETMARQVKQMNRLIDDLLDVSRIASNKIEIRKETTSLAPILHDVMEAGRPIAEHAALELSLTQPDESIFISCDPARLTQVFSNLVTNACKYTPRGGRVELTVESHDGEVIVSVTDTGVGIPRELLPKVFDLFMQVEGTLDRARGGLGLGLPLVKRLVEMHGGSVTAHSDGSGLGSRFVVRLPTLAEEIVVSGTPGGVDSVAHGYAPVHQV